MLFERLTAVKPIYAAIPVNSGISWMLSNTVELSALRPGKKCRASPTETITKVAMENMIKGLPNLYAVPKKPK